MDEKQKAPSEKNIEILFVRHALNLCGESATLFAPSTREEYKSGYDAKFVGQGCREIYLQFKTPRILTKGGFSISLNPPQHKRLLNYPPDAAFYVFSAFTSKEDLKEQQIQLPKPKDFLNLYLAVEVHSMPLTTDFFHYSCCAYKKPCNVKFKLERDGNIQSAPHQVDGKACYQGASLIKSFKNRRIGQTLSGIESESRGDEVQVKNYLTLFEPEDFTREGTKNGPKEDQNFGISIRIVGEK